MAERGEADVQQLVAALETARAQLTALVRQEEVLRLSMEEYGRARETMARYAEAPVGTEVLVPIGADSFLFAHVADVEKCIVGIGANVALEDSLEKAMGRIDRRVEQLQSVQEDVVQRIGQMEERVNAYTATIQQEYDRLQRGTPAEERGEEGV